MSKNEITFKEYLLMLGMPENWFYKYMVKQYTVSVVKKGEHFSTCVWGFQADPLNKKWKDKFISSNKIKFIPLEKVFPENSKNLYRFERVPDNKTLRTKLPLKKAIQNFKDGMKKIHKDIHDMTSCDVFKGEDYYESYLGEVIIDKFAEEEYESFGFAYGDTENYDYGDEDSAEWGYDEKVKGKVHLLPTFLDGEKYFLYEVKDTLYVRDAFYLQYIHETSLELHDKIVRF